METPYDTTYGQRSALPDVDENDETSMEALAYLRNVRSEASLIPHLLVSKDKLIAQTEMDDFDGYYEDGAYTGIASSQEDSEEHSSNQRACYDAIRVKFSALRSRLAVSSQQGSQEHSQSTATDPHASHSQYNHGFLYTSPRIQHITTMSQDHVILSLKRYESVLNKRNLMMGDLEQTNLGTWGWSLLAKCRPAQQMDGDDIAVIREVGKAAIRVSKKIIRESRGSDAEESRPENEESAEGVSASIKDREQSALFTLDMLITIVGEDFGQRDLLEARERW